MNQCAWIDLIASRGGASGIGLAVGRALADAGMRVMLADIEAKPLEYP